MASDEPAEESQAKDSITVKVGSRQLELLDRLDKVYGSNRSEKIRHILAEWLAKRLDTVFPP